MASAAAADARMRRVSDSRPAVLVTGASRGIGEACTLRLARDGFRVYAGVRKQQDGELLIAHGGDAIVPVMLDVTDRGQIDATAARLDAECGERGLQALVNNAGIAVAGPLEFLPIDELRRQLEVNVVGQIAVLQACMPLLRRSRAGASVDHRCGRIVFMSSVAGRSAPPFMGPYAASKHAIEALADSLRVELQPFGMRVILVEPGVIATPIWKTSIATALRILEPVQETIDEFYGAPLAAIRRRAERGMGGSPPEIVAEAVSHALTARRPHERYLLGRGARARVVLEAMIPTAVRDRMIANRIRKG